MGKAGWMLVLLLWFCTHTHTQTRSAYLINAGWEYIWCISFDEIYMYIYILWLNGVCVLVVCVCMCVGECECGDECDVKCDVMWKRWLPFVGWFGSVVEFRSSRPVYVILREPFCVACAAKCGWHVAASRRRRRA